MNDSVGDAIRRLKAESVKAAIDIARAFEAERFLINTPADKRLASSLSLIDRSDLVDRTLLSAKVHRSHSERLSKRYVAVFNKLMARADGRALRSGVKAPSEHQVAGSHLRFVTIIDSVSIVDASVAVGIASALKTRISDIVKATPGIWCLGALEVEVVSMEKMRGVRDRDPRSSSEYRKLDVCEVLEKSIKENNDSLFLIHFHGVMAAQDESQFEALRANFRSVGQWCLAARQIEIKKLSEEFAGKSKPVANSLNNIAQYITKGGNDWNTGKAYFNYKFGFDGEDEDSWVRKNVYRNELLRKEHIEDGIVDPLSLSAGEIGQLAILIDAMMGLNRTRDGYLVSAGCRI